jgi:MoaA/NifB/PqqE/SkfB family radical SAM enzyme
MLSSYKKPPSGYKYFILIFNMKPSHLFWTGLRITGYKMGRRLGRPLPMPVNLAVCITQRCNSRCRTCNVWRNPPGDEMSVGEWERVFRSIGRSHSWITFSEGESFLSKDAVSITRVIVENNDPQILLFPTNGILTRRVLDSVREILGFYRGRLIVNLSMDGVGEAHDRIRGVKGNFRKLLRTIDALSGLRDEFKNLSIGVNTVVSRFNIDHVEEIQDFVSKEISPDAHIFEIARNGASLYNRGTDIRPDSGRYLEFAENLGGKDSGRTLTHFFRRRYYSLLRETLEREKAVIPCYAGISSAHISSSGEVWGCSMLCEPLGNLRKSGYDFKRVWKSEQARKVREGIRKRGCWCTMANSSYTNMLCSPGRLLRA